MSRTPKRSEYWEAVASFIETEALPTLVTGDLNTRDQRFSTSHSTQYRYITNLLTRCQLTLLNDRNQPTRQSSTLDISLTTPPLTRLQPQWAVHNDLMSDHYPTTISIRLSLADRPAHHPKHTSDIDIPHSIQKFLSHLKTHPPLTLADFYDGLVSTLQYRYTRTTVCKFWNDELQSLRQARNKHRTRIRRARRAGYLTPNTIDGYNNAQREFTNAFKRAKTEFMKKQVEEAIQDPTGRRVWSLARTLQPRINKKTSPVADTNGTHSGRHE
jgi:hypothetical protein